ncbi:hypothetical protein F5X96DRAFT_623600 [Biscogniauxia mediterranea]|nr:hypothetical protein F5X96DRAFT_623600 [Biscogniauxia mediterranea]
MFWKRISKLLAWLLLASYVAAFPSSLDYRSDSDDDSDLDDMVVVGYRTCTKLEAQNLQKEVSRNTNFDKPEARAQLGYGIYTSPSPGEYMAAGENWYVVFYMDEDFFKALPKVWIPENYGGSEIWESEQAVANYIAQHTDIPAENRGQALRLAPFSTDKKKLQMLIPTQLANGHGGLIKARAAAKVDDLPDKDSVDYGDWDNVIGKKP